MNKRMWLGGVVGISLFFCLYSGSAGAGAQQDVRTMLAEQLEAFGDRLQIIQDQDGQDGIEAAHQVFIQEVQQKLFLLDQTIDQTLLRLSEEEAQKYVLKIQQDQEDASEEFFKDPSLSAREKIKLFTQKILIKSNLKTMEQWQGEASKKGYKKMFHELASQLRDRSWRDERPNPNWRAIMLLSGVLLVEVLVPYPASAYLAGGLLILIVYLELRDFYAWQYQEDPVYFPSPSNSSRLIPDDQ